MGEPPNYFGNNAMRMFDRFRSTRETEKTEAAVVAEIEAKFEVINLFWRHLRKTHEDGLKIGDETTIELVKRAVTRKCLTEYIDVTECEISDDTSSINITVYGKVLTIK